MHPPRFVADPGRTKGGRGQRQTRAFAGTLAKPSQQAIQHLGAGIRTSKRPKTSRLRTGELAREHNRPHRFVWTVGVPLCLWWSGVSARGGRPPAMDGRRNGHGCPGFRSRHSCNDAVGVKRLARGPILLTVALIPVAVDVSAAATRGAVHARAGRYVDRAGWSLTYPAGWRVERSTNGPGRVTFYEVTVANFIQQRAVHVKVTPNTVSIGVAPPLDPTGRFPRDGVAFRMLMESGGVGPADTLPDSRFPVRLSWFRHSPYEHQPAGVPAPVGRAVIADGQNYAATAWIGRDASPPLRMALSRVIASLRFPRLHPGATVGDFTVFQAPAAYPVGSFTLIHAPGEICTGVVGQCQSGSAPFYLVHATGRVPLPPFVRCVPEASCTPVGSFYAIGWKAEFSGGDYSSQCDLQLDTIYRPVLLHQHRRTLGPPRTRNHSATRSNRRRPAPVRIRQNRLGRPRDPGRRVRRISAPRHGGADTVARLESVLTPLSTPLSPDARSRFRSREPAHVGPGVGSRVLGDVGRAGDVRVVIAGRSRRALRATGS